MHICYDCIFTFKVHVLSQQKNVVQRILSCYKLFTLQLGTGTQIHNLLENTSQRKSMFWQRIWLQLYGKTFKTVNFSNIF